MGSLETGKKFDRDAFKSGYSAVIRKTQTGGALDAAAKFVVDALEEHPDRTSQILTILDQMWKEGIPGRDSNETFKRWERDAIIVELVARKSGANVSLSPKPEAAEATHENVTRALGN